MLVLTRKKGEQIEINNEITITLLSIEGKRVRLGFHAPKEVPILRKELAVSLDRPGFPVESQFGMDGLAEQLVGTG